jgi:hypothetical protein
VLIVHAAGNDAKILTVMIITLTILMIKKQNCGQYDHYWCFELWYGNKVVAFLKHRKVNVDVLRRV